MSRKQLPQRMVYLLLIMLFVAAASGCGTVQSLFAVPTPATLPQPGGWTASAESLGEFVFEVAPDSTAVTLVFFHFRQFECGSTTTNERWVHGDWFPDTNNIGTITNGEFSIGPQVSGRYVLTFGGSQPDFSSFDETTIRGKFDETGTHASGTWKISWDGLLWPSSLAGDPLRVDRAIGKDEALEIRAHPLHL